MNKLDSLTDSFVNRLESFMIGCDSQEEIKAWNKEINGEMDAYYLNEFISTVLRLVAADKIINENEVEYINQCFGFDYSLEELQEIYDNCHEEISGSISDRLSDDYKRLQTINNKLAEEFKQLLILMCDVIVESDGVVNDSEKKELELIINAFN